jgi:hypothetical protein
VNIIRRSLALLIVASLAFGQSGCAATPMVDTEFASGLPINKNPELPFQKVWIKPGVNWDSYERVYLPSVKVDRLSTMDWWQKTGRELEMKHDLYTIATFTRKEFNRAFLIGFGAKYRIVAEPGLNTLMFEMAIVEVVPNKSVVFEACVRDGKTNEALLMVADRAVGRRVLIDTKSSTAWGETVEGIIKEWAQRFVDVVNREPGEIIER